MGGQVWILMSSLLPALKVMQFLRPLTLVSTDDMREPFTSDLWLSSIIFPDVMVPETAENYCAIAEGLTWGVRHLQLTLRKFWKQWEQEYLLVLQDDHPHSCLTSVVDNSIQQGWTVTVYDELRQQGLWRLGVVKSSVFGADGVTRGAKVHLLANTGRPIMLCRPIQYLDPLEVTSQQVPKEDKLQYLSRKHSRTFREDTPNEGKLCKPGTECSNFWLIEWLWTVHVLKWVEISMRTLCWTVHVQQGEDVALVVSV